MHIHGNVVEQNATIREAHLFKRSLWQARKKAESMRTGKHFERVLFFNIKGQSVKWVLDYCMGKPD